MERRLQKEYDELKRSLAKPSFWIDRESAELLHVEDLQLGYDERPLFEPLNFRLQHGERLHLIGRNGAGKTTLVRAITAASKGEPIETLLADNVLCAAKLRLSVYEQELKPEFMHKTLAQSVEHIYDELGLEMSEEIVKRVLSDYLFDPYQDGRLTVAQLSGGQKARLQIVKMLANNPNLLILDEPTNHLDLPSIEELENALMNYHGALLYVSHDSYFARNIGGEQLILKAFQKS